MSRVAEFGVWRVGLECESFQELELPVQDLPHMETLVYVAIQA